MSMYDHCLYFNLSALNRRITKIWEEEFGTLGLSPSHGYILAAIFEERGISHKALCELMEMDPSTITRFLDKLEKKGLIIKSNKWKGATFQITHEGNLTSRKIIKLMGKLFNRMQTQFGKSEFSDLVDRLQRTRRSIK
jgi:DNA-binding MarR family transcriptional regulator